MIDEVTEPTEWVSLMAPVPKKNVSVRICVDLTKSNKIEQVCSTREVSVAYG